MTDALLSANEVVKRYSGHLALDRVSLTIPRGSIFGLLGPNGAGKTSLIRIINQITAPDSGHILFEDSALSPVHVKKIGYLPEERGLYKKMEVGAQVLYFAQLKGMTRAGAEDSARFWFEKFQLESWWSRPVEDLSKGMQQKVQFIATVVHDPELLILDEPFSGFDPVNAELVKTELLALAKRGKSILFSTHRLEGIEDFATHIALINKAEKILDGSTKDIILKYKTGLFEVDYSTSVPIDWGLTRFNLSTLETHEDYVTGRFKVSGTLNELLTFLIERATVLKVTEVVPTIASLFTRLVSNG